jgi:hypothetical protein
LNVAAAEPPSWGTGSGKGAPQEGDRRGMAEAKKLAQASVHVTGFDGKHHRQGDSRRRCIFADVIGAKAHTLHGTARYSGRYRPKKGRR